MRIIRTANEIDITSEEGLLLAGAISLLFHNDTNVNLDDIIKKIAKASFELFNDTDTYHDRKILYERFYKIDKISKEIINGK